MWHRVVRAILVPGTLALLVMVLAGCGSSQKSYRADRYDVNIAVQPDGSLQVTETVVFRFSGGPFTYVYRELRTQRTDGITGIRATLDGEALPRGKGQNQVAVSGESPIKVQWNLAPTADAAHTFGLSYQVLGVVRAEGDADVLAWGALPAQHAYRIDASTVTITWPEQASPLGPVRIIEGEGAVVQTATGVTISSRDLGRNEELTFEQRFPAGSITGTQGANAPRWQAQQQAARRAAPPFMALAAAIALLGSLGWMLWGRGAPGPARSGDAYVPERSAPPDDLTPAEAGLITATAAQPAWPHALGTLFDLGRRGVIDIQQTGQSRWGDNAKNYTLRLLDAGSTLTTYERGLLDLVFRDKHGTEQTSMSLAKVREHMTKRWKSFKEPLLEDLRMAGLIDRARERTRSRMLLWAFVLMGLSLATFIALAVIFLPSGFWPPLTLAGAAFIVSIAGLVVASLYSPLSPEGVQEAAQWRDFQAYVRKVTKGHEGLVNLSTYEAYLPYAAAFGLGQAWAKSMGRAGLSEVPGWFHVLAGARGDNSAAFIAMISAHSSVGASAGGAAAGGAAGGGGSGAG